MLRELGVTSTTLFSFDADVVMSVFTPAVAIFALLAATLHFWLVRRSILATGTTGFDMVFS